MPRDFAKQFSLPRPLSHTACILVFFYLFLIWKPLVSLKKLNQRFWRVVTGCQWRFLPLINKPGHSINLSFHMTKWQTKAVFSQLFIDPIISYYQVFMRTICMHIFIFFTILVHSYFVLSESLLKLKFRWSRCTCRKVSTIRLLVARKVRWQRPR